MIKETGPMIWVVEDDPSAQRIIVANLKAHGFRSEIFNNAEKAYATLEYGEMPALMILDILLPGMSGVDLIRLLKQNKEWMKIPVVVVSVLRRQDAPTSGDPDALNTTYWVNKPFEANDLIRTIESILVAVR